MISMSVWAANFAAEIVIKESTPVLCARSFFSYNSLDSMAGAVLLHGMHARTQQHKPNSTTLIIVTFYAASSLLHLEYK